MQNKKISVGIVGAGVIAQTHLEVLKKLPHIQLAAICDVKKNKAAALAKKYQIPHIYDSIEEMLLNKNFSHVHILVPPNLHTKVALPFLEAGYSVFLEKPMAETPEECQKLLETCHQHNARLWVNHNYSYQPAYLELKKILQSGSLGKIHHAILHWNFPLRQLNSQQFGHWMFQEPVNILLEQLIHPLSQLEDLLGGIQKIHAKNLHHRELCPGKSFFDTWNVCVWGQKSTGEIYFSVGTNYCSVGIMVICDDGIAFVDLFGNICSVQKQTKWPLFYDLYTKGQEFISQYKYCNRRNLWNYLLSTLHLKKRSDSFYFSMEKSILAFYENNAEQNNVLQSSTGAKLVQFCHDIIKNADISPAITQLQMKFFSLEKKEHFDAVLIGGTGFIGRKLVEKMVTNGKKILVAARNISNLDDIFYHDNVTMVAADISNSRKIDEIISTSSLVIHLAHGGAASTWEEVQEGMIAGTLNIAQSCLKHKVKKLIYIGTIASLYLGNPKEIITGKTPNDSKIKQRGLYSRGKAECERLLMEMQQQGLPLCIMRPGVVIGEGGLAFHSGIGLFNQDTYCIGWNKGKNPLPLILVEDVADAIFLAAQSEISLGKTYNIVGDVRLTAVEYIQELARTLERPLKYLPQPIWKSQTIEIIKWLVKVIFQHRKVNFPSCRDLKSRGLVAQFDCNDLKNELGWNPEQNRNIFIQKSIEVFGKIR